MRFSLLLFFASLSWGSVIFNVGTSGATCASGAASAFSGGSFVVLTGSCTGNGAGPSTFGASGTGSGIIGANLVIGYDIAFSSPVSSGNLAVAINGLQYTVSNLVTNGIVVVPVNPVLVGQTLNTWGINAQFADFPNYTVNVNNIYISETPFGNGSSQTNPLPPSGGANGNWTFINVTSGRWGDPPFVTGFEYSGLSGTLFSSITLPTGFSSPFEVLYGSGFSNTTGPIAGGSAVNFVALGGAVGSFRVRGINPVVDAANPTAFPLQTFFTTATGSYQMTPIDAVPEPGTWGLVAAGLALAASRRPRAKVTKPLLRKGGRAFSWR